jgi:hypothetical protein
LNFRRGKFRKSPDEHNISGKSPVCCRANDKETCERSSAIYHSTSHLSLFTIQNARVVGGQTRTFERHMPKGMRVQVPPRAISAAFAKGYSAPGGSDPLKDGFAVAKAGGQKSANATRPITARASTLSYRAANARESRVHTAGSPFVQSAVDVTNR